MTLVTNPWSLVAILHSDPDSYLDSRITHTRKVVTPPVALSPARPLAPSLHRSFTPSPCLPVP